MTEYDIKHANEVDLCNRIIEITNLLSNAVELKEKLGENIIPYNTYLKLRDERADIRAELISRFGDVVLPDSSNMA